MGFVSQILALHDDAFVYAGAREPAKATQLKALEQKYPGRIAIVECVSADVEGNAALAKEIEERHGRVDTVIANAGMYSVSICSSSQTSQIALLTMLSGLGDLKGSVLEVTVAALEEHFKVCTSATESLQSHVLMRLDTGQRHRPGWCCRSQR